MERASGKQIVASLIFSRNLLFEIMSDSEAASVFVLEPLVNFFSACDLLIFKPHGAFGLHDVLWMQALCLNS